MLACTHFLVLKDEFMQVLGNGIKIIDSMDGVIKRLVSIVNKVTAECNNKKNSFYITGSSPPEKRYYDFAKKFNINFGGIIWE